MKRLYYKNIPVSKLKNIKLLALDVDGVLTDGGMYYSSTGAELKKFNAHDGMGIVLLQEAGIKVAIITSENTEIVRRRAAKLHIADVMQGIKNNAMGECHRFQISREIFV